MTNGVIVHLSDSERTLVQKALFKELRARPDEGPQIEQLFEKLNTAVSHFQVLVIPAERSADLDVQASKGMKDTK